MNRWYVEILKNDRWERTAGRWIFEAAAARARELAINTGTCTRLVKARGAS